MCKLLDNIKLCTCNLPLDKEKNYWVYYKFNKHKDESYIVGEVMALPQIEEEIQKGNIITLLHQLNTNKEIFDTPIQVNSKDRIALCFLFNDVYVYYGFEFKKGKWKSIDPDFIEWMWHHDKIKEGVIK